MLFLNYLHFGKGVALHLTKLKSPSPRDTLCQVWLKLAQWFWRRRWKCEKFTDRRTDRQTTDDRWLEKLPWAFTSGELKKTVKRFIIPSTTTLGCIGTKNSIWRLHHYRSRAPNIDLLTYNHGNWLSSEASSTCYAYCDARQRLKRSPPRTRGTTTHTYCRAFGSGTITTCFKRLRSVPTVDQTPISRMRGERSTTTPPRYAYVSIIQIG